MVSTTVNDFLLPSRILWFSLVANQCLYTRTPEGTGRNSRAKSELGIHSRQLHDTLKAGSVLAPRNPPANESYVDTFISCVFTVSYLVCLRPRQFPFDIDFDF